MELSVETVVANFVIPEGWQVNPNTGICSYTCMLTFWYRHPDGAPPGYLVSFPRMFTFYMTP